MSEERGGDRGVEEAKRTQNKRLVKRRHVLVDLRRAGKVEVIGPRIAEFQSVPQKVTEETKIPMWASALARALIRPASQFQQITRMRSQIFGARPRALAQDQLSAGNAKWPQFRIR